MNRAFAADPLPHVAPALLNSADIQAYQAACDLIQGETFDPSPERMKAASYKIYCRGMVYWTDDKNFRQERRIDDNNPYTLTPNSITFISPDAKFNLPDFIAARFNLAISLVHQGLLLGTGPLVDPGFKGQLLIPVHNLTNRSVELTASTGLIWVEFTKLSTDETQWHGHKSYAFIKSFGDKAVQPQVDTYFKKTNNIPTQSTLADYATRWTSALAEVNRVQRLARNQETRLKRYGLLGAVGGLIALVGLVFSVYSSYIGSVQVAQQAHSVAEQAQQSIQDANKSLTAMEDKLSAASSAMATLSVRLQKVEAIKVHSAAQPNTVKQLKVKAASTPEDH